MRRRVDAHRHVVGVLGGDVVIHLEEVAVTLLKRWPSEAPDGLGEIEVDAAPALPDPTSLVAYFLCGTRRDVARGKVAVTGVLALQVVVALRLGDLLRRTTVTLHLRNPDAAVVAQRLRHPRQFGLEVA